MLHLSLHISDSISFTFSICFAPEAANHDSNLLACVADETKHTRTFSSLLLKWLWSKMVPSERQIWNQSHITNKDCFLLSVWLRILREPFLEFYQFITVLKHSVFVNAWHRSPPGWKHPNRIYVIPWNKWHKTVSSLPECRKILFWKAVHRLTFELHPFHIHCSILRNLFIYFTAKIKIYKVCKIVVKAKWHKSTRICEEGKERSICRPTHHHSLLFGVWTWAYTRQIGLWWTALTSCVHRQEVTSVCVTCAPVETREITNPHYMYVCMHVCTYVCVYIY